MKDSFMNEVFGANILALFSDLARAPHRPQAVLRSQAPIFEVSSSLRCLIVISNIRGLKIFFLNFGNGCINYSLMLVTHLKTSQY